MLDYMRKSSNSVLMYIIFGALAVVFALSFGPGSSGFSPGGGSGYAAIVNGEVIPAQEYQLAFRRRRDQITRQLGGQTFGLESFLNRLPQQVIDSMVSSVLLKQEAEQLGLVVSDEELSEWMAANVFSSDGVTPQVYRDWVRQQFGTSVADQVFLELK
ncbi:MAG: SurA N-terminal domain-containing protein, partial [Myxococcota bacterium]